MQQRRFSPRQHASISVTISGKRNKRALAKFLDFPGPLHNPGKGEGSSVMNDTEFSTIFDQVEQKYDVEK